MGDFLLDDQDMTYMRETQTLTRPTEATLRRVATSTPDGMGGSTTTVDPDGTPVNIRVHHLNNAQSRDDIPAELAEQYRTDDLVKIVMDLVPVGVGDLLAEVVVPTRRYEVVSQGRVDEWTTAQIVWGIRS